MHRFVFDGITCEQLMTMLFNHANKTGLDTSARTDERKAFDCWEVVADASRSLRFFIDRALASRAGA